MCARTSPPPAAACPTRRCADAWPRMSPGFENAAPMPEWWTYGLSDFLMFSPEAYWRLIARHNAASWPAQVVGLGLALALPWLVHHGSARPVLLVLAAAWAW